MSSAPALTSEASSAGHGTPDCGRWPWRRPFACASCRRPLRGAAGPGWPPRRRQFQAVPPQPTGWEPTWPGPCHCRTGDVPGCNRDPAGSCSRSDCRNHGCTPLAGENHSVAACFGRRYLPRWSMRCRYRCRWYWRGLESFQNMGISFSSRRTQTQVSRISL